jgi:glyoxylase-like metal-dependent hydrolase (beta-lactamase superfamily II)
VGDLFASLEGTPGCPAFFTYPGGKSDIIYRSIKLLLDLGAHIFYSGHGGPFTAVYVREALQKDIGLV